MFAYYYSDNHPNVYDYYNYMVFAWIESKLLKHNYDLYIHKKVINLVYDYYNCMVFAWIESKLLKNNYVLYYLFRSVL